MFCRLQLYCISRWKSTECPKIYRKYVLHLLKFIAKLYLSRCSTDCGKFWDTPYIMNNRCTVPICLVVRNDQQYKTDHDNRRHTKLPYLIIIHSEFSYFWKKNSVLTMVLIKDGSLRYVFRSTAAQNWNQWRKNDPFSLTSAQRVTIWYKYHGPDYKW